jgi:hypothetical protein
MNEGGWKFGPEEARGWLHLAPPAVAALLFGFGTLVYRHTGYDTAALAMMAVGLIILAWYGISELR